MQALQVFGGITKTKIPFEIPEDDTRLAELELVFNRDHENVTNPDYEQEAAELFARYSRELNQQKILELNKKLENLDEDSEEYEKILKQIYGLQNPF